MLKRITLSLLMLFFLTEASAKIYQWKDESGKVHYSDKKPSEANNRKIIVKSVNEFSYRSSAVDAGDRVIIYSTDWCVHCKRAKRYFRDNNIPFVEYDIEKNDTAKQRYDELEGRGVPLILVGKKRMSGFSKAGFEQLYVKN